MMSSPPAARDPASGRTCCGRCCLCPHSPASGGLFASHRECPDQGGGSQRCAERLPSRQRFSSSDCLGDAVISDENRCGMLITEPGTSCLRSLYRKAQMHQLSHKEDNAKAWRVLCVLLLLLFLFSHQFFARKTPWTLEGPRLFSANFLSCSQSVLLQPRHPDMGNV